MFFDIQPEPAPLRQGKAAFSLINRVPLDPRASLPHGCPRQRLHNPDRCHLFPTIEWPDLNPRVACFGQYPLFHSSAGSDPTNRGPPPVRAGRVFLRPVHWNIVLGRRTTGNSLMQEQIGTVAVPVTEHRVLTESIIPEEGTSIGFAGACFFSSRTNFITGRGRANAAPFLIADTHGGAIILRLVAALLS